LYLLQKVIPFWQLKRALRHQLLVLQRQKKPQLLKNWDRLLWMFLSKVWSQWRSALFIVKPETVIRWHRTLFKRHWSRKSSRKSKGRPPLSAETKKLIREMATANLYWGAPRIHGELKKLGIEVSQRTVSNNIPKDRKPPSQTWKTFLQNHMATIVACDFLVVPTIDFNLLYVFVMLNLERREVVGFGVTKNPKAQWTANVFADTFPWDTAPRYLLRDRDSIYGKVFKERVKEFGVKEVVTAFKSPWQNGYVERLMGSIRRECLDHMIILNEQHLRSVLKNYFQYYHEDRTHLGLEKDTPKLRVIDVQPESGEVLKEPRLGGLHHRYRWKKAA
jgi:transposase InsO family protein